MSQNTTVEWSQTKTGIEGDNGLNFLTTSHDEKMERGMGNLYVGQLQYRYTIRELNHNHPGNIAYPSGLPNSSNPGEGDIGFSRGIINHRQKNRWNIPTFNIYLPRSKSYINYGPNSIRSDYEK